MTASTAGYLWSLEDILGQGATASVHKARNKKTGELVAVKVFNVVSYSRPYEVQMREFEMLRRLNHVNIVKLFTVEEMHMNPKQKVLVMEYCSGGSLLNQLEEPENAFGLPEAEFLIVLQCVVHGMNHLRQNGVVHRDIKPGNIMRQVGEDGRSIYKLTDFGAARELEDDEKFMSIYGTEEYLHPDMYERAVLRKPQQKTYGVSVDLWSVGVTFYHAACGSLPFVPYGGPRRNKQTMYKITTEKPTGAIAGLQRVLDGPIEWSYQLPHQCQLSEGLKGQMVPVLAGILEANQDKCWGFDQFLAATTDILHRVTVHLFSLQQATAHTIYIHFYNTASIFCEEVQAQMGMEVDLQSFLYQGHRLLLEPGMKVVNLPPTTPQRPLFLFGRRPNNTREPRHREPESQVIPTRFDVMADYSFSKTMVGVIHQYLKLTRSLHMTRDLMLQGFYSYMSRAHVDCEAAIPKISIITVKLQSCLNLEDKIYSLSQSHSNFTECSDNQRRLRQVQENLPVYANGIREFQNKVEHLQVELAKHSETLAEDKNVQKMEILLGKIVCIHQQFRKDRSMGNLSYNDEQIHKFEKINLSTHIKKVKSLYRDDCMKKLQDVLLSSDSWTSVLFEIQSRLQDFSTFFRQLMEDLQVCYEEQNKCLDEALQRVLQSASGSEGTGKDHMILRMNRLKDEMEVLARELQSNNRIIESLGAVNSGIVLQPDAAQPKAM
ncbi:LOW QUALITY PROTEIN: inhibitor of nuclear factor kappa-B kinase subunit epsilon [Alosa alosa]|uniref:LOW QUALITY PROTEIN: inhibitor of nuclear factor kappa-B kinase subunit epsilon n=1 Tax=Alosa alosa TaxID=278164 RepID=UPI0020152623|nr:LOW QUALITY PROTEIN: inhibitor of nuclear factor kappa-B kinase subunit epsilon [Alosa alosa]